MEEVWTFRLSQEENDGDGRMDFLLVGEGIATPASKILARNDLTR